MVGVVYVEQKKFSCTNIQNLRKCKVFKAYGYLLYYMSSTLWKHLNILHVIEPVVLSVNYIHSGEFNHHWFHEFLSDTKAGYLHLILLYSSLIS